MEQLTKFEEELKKEMYWKTQNKEEDGAQEADDDMVLRASAEVSPPKKPLKKQKKGKKG